MGSKLLALKDRILRELFLGIIIWEEWKDLLVALWADPSIVNICPMEVLWFTHVYTSLVIPIKTHLAIHSLLVILDLLHANRAGKRPWVSFNIATYK